MKMNHSELTPHVLLR